MNISLSPSEAAGTQAGNEGKRIRRMQGKTWSLRACREEETHPRSVTHAQAMRIILERRMSQAELLRVKSRKGGRSPTHVPTHLLLPSQTPPIQGLIRARYNHSPTPPFTSQSQMMSIPARSAKIPLNTSYKARMNR